MAGLAICRQYDWIVHTQRMLDSYARLLGTELIVRQGTVEDQAVALFDAPFVVVSHNTLADPILNYGNQAALDLWEMEIDVLRQTPSRLTAEPACRDERARLLERTTREGYVDDYRGIRITRSGRRFRIDRAVVWNLQDELGEPYGQAATFDRWHWLD